MVSYVLKIRRAALVSSKPALIPGLELTSSKEYGQCGVGAYCLGGCDPVNSFSLDSCVPAPVCQSATYTFDNLNNLAPNTEYLGDASKADWVYSGTPLSYQGQVLLTMAQGTVGTLLASTHYVWYGKTTAKFTTSAGAGVITAFILLSDVKDEIDFEFVGVELSSAQTNFYNQGVTNYNNGENQTGLSDVHLNQHTYEIDWHPDNITWSIDGNPVRTLNRADTWNETAGRFSFPQTPARVQLSIWPAGLPTNGEGTIEWGGGLVDWNSPYMTNGYYYAAFEEVDVQCYDPPSGANVQGTNSYIYTDVAATNNTVEITNDKTVLKCLLGTGLNLTAGCPSGTSTASVTSQTPQATVPGVPGTGPGSNGQRGDNTISGTQTVTQTGSAATGFVQGNGGTNGGVSVWPEVLPGSFFAAVVGLVALLSL
jgi:beta-glucanase (GH16 family)